MHYLSMFFLESKDQKCRGIEQCKGTLRDLKNQAAKLKFCSREIVEVEKNLLKE